MKCKWKHLFSNLPWRWSRCIQFVLARSTRNNK